MNEKSVTIRRVEVKEHSCNGCAFEADECGCCSLCKHIVYTLGIGPCSDGNGSYVYVVEVENG